MAEYPIYRLVKGDQLTFTEMDNNLRWLSQNMSGSQLTLTGSTIGVTGSMTVTGDIQVTGTASIGFIKSEGFSTGSNQLGNDTGDFQTLVGTVSISGSLDVSGSTQIPNLTGSLFGTSSWALNALTASYVLTSSLINNFFVQGGNSFGTTAILGTNDVQDLQFKTSGYTRAFISSSGVIAIGTSSVSPNTKLQVALASDESARFGSWEINTFGVNAATIGENVYFGAGGLWRYRNDGYATQIVGAGGVGFQVRVAPFGTAGNIVSYIEPFTIAPDGKVGIGTTSPTLATLEVQGNVFASSYTGSLFGTASWALNSLTASVAINAISASYVSGSAAIVTNLTSSNALITGTITAQTLVVQTITSSVIYSSGSNVFGNQLTNTQVFTGSVRITGSLNVKNIPQGNYTNILLLDTASGDIYTTSSLSILVKNADSSSYPIATSGSSLYSTGPAAGIPTGASMTGSIFFGQLAGLSSSANYSTFIGRYAGGYATNTQDSIFFGQEAGYGSDDADDSTFIGRRAGYISLYSDNSIFMGREAGSRATSSYSSVFLGPYAGYGTDYAFNSNFIGSSAGYETTANNANFIGNQAGANATNADNSNFIGTQAGLQATNANFSTIIGQGAGAYAASASYSILLGYNAGYNQLGLPNLSIKSNNIIVGTNISLPAGAKDSINIGGIIFASGSYSTTTGGPFSGSVTNARVGILTNNPQFTLDVSGSGRYTNNLQVTGSLSVSSLSTNNLASFISAEPYINIIAAGATNGAALFLSPSAGYNGGIHNRTGGGLEFYTGVTPSVAMTINASGNTIATGSVTANLGFTGSLFGTASQATALQNTGSTGFVSNMGDTYTGSAKITNIITLTAAEYSGIGSPASNTLYVVI